MPDSVPSNSDLDIDRELGLPPDARPIDRLLAIMARLRDPVRGCGWDVSQNFATIAPYTMEEAYEVAEAIELADMGALRDELGDLLFQVVFHARMGQEAGAFDFDAVATSIADKMVRRHPHVFGPAEQRALDMQPGTWEKLKAQERAAKAESVEAVPSALDGVTRTLPALTRALKLQSRAARVGFDWSEAPPILDKLAEEVTELKAEMDAATIDPDRLEDELGDILFVCVNLARHLKVDPEAALKRTNAKFERRFKRIEALLAEAGADIEKTPLDRLEELWTQAKMEERR